MQPAATIGCNHTCPIPKHPGGPVTMGSQDVLVEKKGVCRQSDQLVCEGTDTVLKGSLTVFVNGLPAARMGDPTAHGGVIVQGASSVFIG